MTYVYLDDAPLAQIDAGTPEVLTYLHTDHLGTPRFGTNTGGTQVWAWASDAFGNGAPTGAATVNLRMPGQYFDTESDLFYNWNRYYNPVIGRYISSDPIGIDGGLNTFLYAEASPVMFDDPEGLAAGYLLQAGKAVCKRPLSCLPTIGKTIKKIFENEKANNPSKIQGKIVATDANVCTSGNPAGGPDDPDDEPAIQDLQKVTNNQEANRVAREHGFRDAHEAKNKRGGSKTNIYKDKKTGEYYIWDGIATTARQKL